MTEFSETVEQSKGTVHQYLKTLEERGTSNALGRTTRSESGFSAWADRPVVGSGFSNWVGTMSTGWRPKLARKGVLSSNGTWRASLYQATGENVDTPRTHVGHIECLHSTAGSKAILAGLSDTEIRECVGATELPTRTANTITGPDELWADIERVRSRGVALDDGEHYENVRCVAEPVVVNDDRVLATLSVSAPAERMSDEQFRSTVPEKLEATAGVVGVKTLYSEWIDS